VVWKGPVSESLSDFMTYAICLNFVFSKILISVLKDWSRNGCRWVEVC